MSSVSDDLPLVGVISDRRSLGHHAFQVQGEKYLLAVIEGARAYPLGLPAIPRGDHGFQPAAVLDRLDGLLLTGSPSNVEPHRYGAAPGQEGARLDPPRDDAALELIPAALALGLPLFAICRGFQELNVAMGGSLHQDLGHVPDLGRHKEDAGAPVDVQYGPAHEVVFTPGGMLAALTGRGGARVNSVHGQGIERLGAGLAVEATAPDGLVEAVSVGGAASFALGVQWHPEWDMRSDEVSMALFRAFGAACRTRWQARTGTVRETPARRA